MKINLNNPIISLAAGTESSDGARRPSRTPPRATVIDGGGTAGHGRSSCLHLMCNNVGVPPKLNGSKWVSCFKKAATHTRHSSKTECSLPLRMSDLVCTLQKHYTRCLLNRRISIIHTH